MPIEAGRKAPAFTLADTDGRKRRLRDFAGHDLVIYFYPKDDTPGCTKEACGFRDLWKKFTDLGVAVVGLSPDPPASHRKFADKYELPFPLLCDPDHRVMEEYGAWGEKVLYGRKSRGVIRSTVWIGRDGRVKKHWKRVAKAAEHPARVLEAIRAEG